MKFKHLALTYGLTFCLQTAQPQLWANGNNGNPGVISPQASPHGNTYAQWSKAWWQWFLSIPAATHNNPGDCTAGQTGKVWFLAGPPDGPSPTPINCQIPSGTMLFLPALTVDCSDKEAPPFFGATPQEQLQCAKSFVDGIESGLQLTVIVDGTHLQNLKLYRVAAGNFVFNAPPGAVFGIPAGLGSAAAEGYFVMLAPLSKGPHIIRVIAFQPDLGGTLFDTTFNVFVGK